MQNKYTRTTLINQATTWLVDWNYKVFLQSVNDPHPDDISSKDIIDYRYRVWKQLGISGCALPYAVRTKVDAHNALENIVSNWKYGRDGNAFEVQQMVNYYVSLSDKGFNRLFNEVTRKAERRLQIKEDAYWANKCLTEREAK